MKRRFRNNCASSHIYTINSHSLVVQLGVGVVHNVLYQAVPQFQFPFVVRIKVFEVVQQDFLVNEISVDQRVPFSCWFVSGVYSNSNSIGLTGLAVSCDCPSSSSSECTSAKKGCLRACSAVILLLGSNVSIFFIKSMACGETSTPANNESKTFPFLMGRSCICCLVAYGMSMWEMSGVPKHSTMSLISSKVSRPGSKGFFRSISANTQPALQISTLVW